jgi:steroid delta-isomerase-like uncharacterized protein
MSRVRVEVGKNTKTAAVAPPDSKPRANQQLVRRFLEELWNGRKLELADEFVASDCQTHQLRSGADTTSTLRGPKEMRAHVEEWLRGFPDLKFTIEQLFSAGDKVFTQTVMEGTHTGTWLEIPPTNKRVTVRMMTVHRIARGKIAEEWVMVGSLGFFQQLGLIAPTFELFSRAKERLSASS